MSWINIIDFSFSLYRGHFRHFIGIVAIYAGVDALREVLLLFLWEYKPYHLLDDLITNLLNTLGLGILIVMASEVYFDKPITIRDVFRRFTPLFPCYFGYSFAYLIPHSLWSLLSEINKSPDPILSLLLLLSIPFMLYFLIAWILYGPVVILENPMVQSPLSRSRELVRYAWWRVCGTIIAIYILLLVIFLILTISYGLIVASLGLFGEGTIVENILSMVRSTFEPDSVESISLSDAINSIFYVGVNAITAPIYAICVLLLYFNRRTQTESRDI